VVSVPEAPPDIVQLDPYPLLFHARDNAAELLEDTPANRRKGWQRITLFAFYFRPSALNILGAAQTLREARHAADRSIKAYFGLFPFQWQAQWQHSFEALRQAGNLLVAPILQRLILNRAPQETLAWVDRIASWDFEQLLPCHFAAPVLAGPQDWRQAFTFLRPSTTRDRAVASPYLPEADFAFLEELEGELIKRHITPPAQKSA
jgi:hypothetical protein